MKTKRSAHNNTGGEILQPDHIQQLTVERKLPGTVVRLLNKRTGRVVDIAHKTAELLTRKYPEEFKTL